MITVTHAKVVLFSLSGKKEMYSRWGLITLSDPAGTRVLGFTDNEGLTVPGSQVAHFELYGILGTITLISKEKIM